MSRYIDAEWLNELFPDTGEGEWTYNATALGYIDSAPSIDIEPKRGEWLFKEITDDYHVTGLCSICKERRRIDNFCPNCGADMRERKGK